MDSVIPVIDLTSDNDVSLIDISVEEEDCLISASSVACCKRKAKEIMSPLKKIKKIEKISTIKQIALNKRIPQGILCMLVPSLFGNSEQHKARNYLAGKRIILYGLPGYHSTYRTPEELFAVSKIWKPFLEERVMKPALEFIEQFECLIGNGINEVLFFTENHELLTAGLNNQITRAKFNTFKFVADKFSYGPKSYHGALGIAKDIDEDVIKGRSRRFLLLIEDLVVKFVRVESSCGEFVVPGVEKIMEVLGI